MVTNNVFDIAASGLNAAQTQLQTTANNIANQDTPNYKAERTDLVDLSGGGVAVSGISQSTSPGDQQGNNVDPAMSYHSKAISFQFSDSTKMV